MELVGLNPVDDLEYIFIGVEILQLLLLRPPLQVAGGLRPLQGVPG